MCDTGERSFQNGGRGGANTFGSDGGFGGGGESETAAVGGGVYSWGGVQFSFSSGVTEGEEGRLHHLSVGLHRLEIVTAMVMCCFNSFFDCCQKKHMI